MRFVSYQRDLGVWMFPGVRRVWFLLAIALKLNAVFVHFFFFFDFLIFIFSIILVLFKVQTPICRLL